MKAAVAAIRMLLLSFKWETGNSDRDENRRDGGRAHWLVLFRRKGDNFLDWF